MMQTQSERVAWALERLTTAAQQQRRVASATHMQDRYQVPSRDAALSGAWGGAVGLARASLDFTFDEKKPWKYDEWLFRMAKSNPLISGVLFSMTQRDASRSWTLVGPYRTVARIRDILHGAERGAGWRHHVSYLAQSYYATNVGALPQWDYAGVAVTEDDGTIVRPPLRAIYSFDPTAARLTDRWQEPIKYDGDLIPLHEVGRFASMPDPRKRMNGLGWCFAARAAEYARLISAVFTAHLEALGQRAPQGFLLIEGVSQQQVEAILGSHQALLDRLQQEVFGGVAVLANDGLRSLDGKWLPVSNMPEGFDFRQFLDLMMLGVALAAGLPVSDVWDIVSGRGYGREGENRESFRRAGSKGRNAFALDHQGELQQVLPSTVSFEYERHNADERLVEAAAAAAWLEVGVLQQQLGVPEDVLLSGMVEAGAAPPAATQVVEDAIITDTGVVQRPRSLNGHAPTRRARDNLLGNYGVRRALEAARFYEIDDPIVLYRWGALPGMAESAPAESIATLWDSYSDALTPRTYAAAAVREASNKRQITDEYEQLLLDLFQAVRDAEEDEAGALWDDVLILSLAAMLLAYYEGAGEPTNDLQRELEAAADDVLAGEATRAQRLLLADAATYQEAFPPFVAGHFSELRAANANSTLAVDLRTQDRFDSDGLLQHHVALWASTALMMREVGFLAREDDPHLMWMLGVAEHCSTCRALAGVVRTASEWRETPFFPRARNGALECNGWLCQCRFAEADGPSRGTLPLPAYEAAFA